MIDEAQRITRTTDPQTSKEAAQAVVKTAPTTRAAVLRILEDFGPLTDTQIASRYATLRELYGFRPTTESSLRTRRRELQREGAVRLVDGETRRTRSGYRARVWEAVPSTRIGQ